MFTSATRRGPYPADAALLAHLEALLAAYELYASRDRELLFALPPATATLRLFIAASGFSYPPFQLVA